MKKISVLLPICAVLALSGCFMSQKSQIVRHEVPYNAQNQARLRIYGQYGRDVVRMIPNSTCEQWAEKQGRRHTRFTGGPPRRIRNLSVGMPATQRSNTVNADTGVVFRESYKEFVVPAGKALVLDGAFSSETTSQVNRCRLAASLTPQPGKDYEVQYARDSNGCDVAVVEILPQANGEVHPTAPHPSSIAPCRAPAIKQQRLAESLGCTETQAAIQFSGSLPS